MKTSATNEITENEQKIVLSQKRGRPAELTISKVTKKPKPSVVLPTDVLGKIQRNLNLSNREVYGVATAIRSESNNTISFEKNYKTKMNDDSHMLDNYFDIIDFEFVKEKKNVITKTPAKGIICSDLSGLITFLKEKRNLCDKTCFKFGMDGGGGFLKFCMSLVCSNCNDKKELTKKNYGKKYSDSGVKKLILLFIAPDVQENYNNISIIWTKLKLNEHLENATVAADLKLINLCCGLQTCSSSHPCAYCEASSNNLGVCGNYRTVNGCTNDFENWKSQTNADKKLTKKFNNCVNKPLLPAGDEKILKYIPPPELHLLLGAVNTVFDKMLVEKESIALNWAKECNVNRKITHGNRYSFVGNDCNKLLNHTDKLASVQCLEIDKYVNFFRKLKKVVDACFSKTLDPNYAEYIKSLKISFMDLDISITPKMHIIFEHVVEYCKYSDEGKFIQSHYKLQFVY